MDNRKTVVLSFLIAFVIVAALLYVDVTTSALAVTLNSMESFGATVLRM